MSLTKGTVVQINAVLYVCFPAVLCSLTELCKDGRSPFIHAKVEIRNQNAERFMVERVHLV